MNEREHYHPCPMCHEIGEPCPHECDIIDYVYDDMGLYEPIIAHPICCSSLCRLEQFVWDRHIARKMEEQERRRATIERLQDHPKIVGAQERIHQPLWSNIHISRRQRRAGYALHEPPEHAGLKRKHARRPHLNRRRPPRPPAGNRGRR